MECVEGLETIQLRINRVRILRHIFKDKVIQGFLNHAAIEHEGVQNQEAPL